MTGLVNLSVRADQVQEGDLLVTGPGSDDFARVTAVIAADDEGVISLQLSRYRDFGPDEVVMIGRHVNTETGEGVAS